MAASSYDVTLTRLLTHEDDYNNHPADPGGPTNFGITIFDYRKYVKPAATAADVKAMKLAEAKAIYRGKYWDAQRCDELPAGLDDCVFDYGVNSGIGRSGKVLRRCLKLADDSGKVDDDVIAAARTADAKALVNAICDERLRFLRGLRTWPVFGKGWARRVAEVRAFSLQLAGGVATQKPETPAPGKGKVPVAKGAQQGSAGAIAAAGAAAAQQAHQGGHSAAVITVIVAFAVVAAIGAWAFWHWRQRRLQEQPA